MDVVISLSLRQSIRDESAGVPFAIRIPLLENGSCSPFRCVGFYSERFRGIGHEKDGSGEEFGFESFECVLSFSGPFPFNVFLHQFVKWFSDIGISTNEASVEVTKTKERSYLFYRGRDWPVAKSVEFDGVHGDMIGFDDEAEVIDALFFKFAFFWFQVEVVIL